eukprot:jgi/Chrzof1/84/Cz01g02290.t1
MFTIFARSNHRLGYRPVAPTLLGSQQSILRPFPSGPFNARYSKASTLLLEATHKEHNKRQLTASAASAAASLVTATGSMSSLQAAIAQAAPYVLILSALYTWGACLLMALLPTARITQSVVKSNWPYVIMAVAYGVLLAGSWEADTLALMMPGSLEAGMHGFNPQFIPSLQSIITLFSRPLTQGSFLVHVLFINLFVARMCYSDGLRCRVPTWHSILLSSIMGPLGVLSHIATKVMYWLLGKIAGKDLRTAAKPWQLRSGDGFITGLPYDE